MERNRLKKNLVFYFLTFLIFSLVFILSFHSPLLFRQKVLFYRGIGLLIVATMITLLVGILFRKIWLLSPETLLAAIILSFSIHLSLFVVFPVTFDRSVTMYLLNVLDQSQTKSECGGLAENQLEELFINEYVKENRAIGRRITEQSIINFVKEKKGCFQITKKGSRFLTISRIIEKIYALK